MVSLVADGLVAALLELAVAWLVAALAFAMACFTCSGVAIGCETVSWRGMIVSLGRRLVGFGDWEAIIPKDQDSIRRSCRWLVVVC